MNSCALFFVFGTSILLFSSSVRSYSNATRNSELNSLPQIRSGQRCVPSQKYRQDCNTCFCSSKGDLYCTQMVCNIFNDKRLGKSKKYLKMDTPKGNFLRKYPQLPPVGCKPGVLYRRGCDRCFCDENSKPLCVPRKCNDPVNLRSMHEPEDTRPRVSITDLVNLPTLPSTSAVCQRGRTYRIACNVCICLANGNLFCDKKICPNPLHDEEYEHYEAIRGKPCSPGESPTSRHGCVTCKCTKGRMNCEMNHNCLSKFLRSGDKSVLRGINPDKDKCKPGQSYVSDCNNCYCQSNGALLCTYRMCLNRSQVETLEARIKELEKNNV